jgi:hypothetical protein
MVIDNRAAKSNKIEDSVFWYKARLDLPPFVLGNRNYWKMHSMFAKDEEEDDDFFDNAFAGIPALSKKSKQKSKDTAQNASIV